ncbi:MAG: hypothetical protein ACK563_08055, partial [Pseudomonadaceae bacterium]
QQDRKQGGVAPKPPSNPGQWRAEKPSRLKPHLPPFVRSGYSRDSYTKPAYRFDACPGLHPGYATESPDMHASQRTIL